MKYSCPHQDGNGWGVEADIYDLFSLMPVVLNFVSDSHEHSVVLSRSFYTTKTHKLFTSLKTKLKTKKEG